MSVARGYAERFVREEPQFALLRRLTTVVVSLFLIFGGFSGYRAWVQVRSVELRPMEPVLRAGSTVTADAVSWARTYVSVRIELVQGTHRETIGWQQIGTHSQPSLDPRWVRSTLSATISPELLEHFREGDATVVATGLGRSQWLRVPPPKVRELHVMLRRAAATMRDGSAYGRAGDDESRVDAKFRSTEIRAS